MSELKIEKTKENKSFNYDNRFNNLLKVLGDTTLLITKIENIYYLTGFKSSVSIFVIHESQKYLITDSRYFDSALDSAHTVNLILSKNTYNETLIMLLKYLGVKSISIAKEGILFTSLESITNVLIKYGIHIDLSDIKIADLRAIKDKEEITIIKDNLYRAEIALTKTLPFFKEGVTEKEMASELEYKMRLEGGDKTSFDTIFLFGERSFMPHGKSSDIKLKHGDIILIDFGMNRNGYNSDITRVFFFGKNEHFEEMSKVYNIVKQAKDEVIEKIYAGMSGFEADRIARDVIEKAGYGDYFTHGLGHGVGLEIHETPSLSPFLDCTLERATVITIEPGIYIKNKGGVRLEDMVIVTKNGAVRLNTTPTDLIVL